LKIAIVGGGSTYIPLIIRSLAEKLPNHFIHFALYDIDPRKTELTASSPLWSSVSNNVKVQSSKEPAAALAGADFVILLYRAGPPNVRFTLEKIAVDHKLLAQETQGICGLFSALFNIAELRRLAPIISRNCPNARIIVLTNPTGIVTAAAQDLGLDAIGVCELPFGMISSINIWLHERELLLDPNHVTYIGLNHFGWITRVTAAESDENMLSSIINNTGTVVYVPPSIPLPVAEAADAVACRGLPNPYIGFLACTPKDYARAKEVSQAEIPTRLAVSAGKWDDYTALIRERGGFLVGPTLANLVGGMARKEPTNAVLCSRNADLAARFCANAAYEFSAIIDPSGAVISVTEESCLPGPAEAMTRLVASYESETVTAALSGSLKNCINAIMLNPYIAAGSSAINALHGFIDDNASAIFDLREP
jgi:alpha-galactosidase/6-phospho-beta-glucosidase family protein